MEKDFRLVKIDKIRKYSLIPMFFYHFLIFPRKRETEKCRKMIKKDTLVVSRSATAKKFAEGKINKGDKIEIGGTCCTFFGANPKKTFPECFLFFDRQEKVFFRFAFSFDGKNPL